MSRARIAALALGLGLAVAAPAQGAPPESIELRLLRSVQLGALQGFGPDEVARFSRDGTRAGYLGFALAAAAAHAAGHGAAAPEWPASRLLDKTLGELTTGLSFETPPDFPPGFGAEDLVFTLVYALAIGGTTEAATDILERHLAGATDYKRAVVLQGLRNIGSPRATGVIQREVERSGGDNLAQNLLADLHYPFLDDLRSRLALIPPHERTRERLAVLAAEGCGIRPALAAYFLGFHGQAARADDERRELELLRQLATLDCHWTRFLAIRSLALRSPESIEFWSGRYRSERDAWQKAQLARIGWARFGAAFAPTALDWLKTEPVQYVQWELMHGALEIARGRVLRDYWDLWQPPTLQLRLKFPPRAARAGPAELDPIFAWIEAGNRPQHPWVRNHLFYGLAREVTDRDLRRYLRAFAALPDRGELWWVLRPLAEKEALPLLRYWESLETDAARRKDAREAIAALEARDDGRSRAPQRCCRPTRECLVSNVAAAQGAATRIATETEARAWLAASGPLRAAPAVRFLDELERIAEVMPAGSAPQRWEHLYGCWRQPGSSGS